MSKTIIAVRHFGLGGRESLETAVTQSTKRIAIINVIGKCVCKGCPYRFYILKFNTLANVFE